MIEYLDVNDRSHEYTVNMIRKDYVVIEFDDGYEVAIELRQPSIDRTMWYDDETEAPERNFENFKEYNLCKVRTFNPEEVWYIARNLSYYVITPLRDVYRRYEEHEIKRALTKEEKEFIAKLYDDYRNKFIKRLETYYKKYKDKIRASGYWANR